MIRPYRDSDFDDVFSLQKICYTQPCSENELQNKLQHGCWIASMYDHLIGAAIVCPEDNKNLLWSITVHPFHQRHGWGSSLMHEVARNYSELWLYVDIASDARRLYEREGFRIDKLLTDHYGPEQHAYLMRWTSSSN